MKALNQHWVATAAALLLTASSLATTVYLSAAPAAGRAQEAQISETRGLKITNLAPVTVHPSADELRSASLLPSIGVAGLATLPTLGRIGESTVETPISLLGSQLTMPYYSFSNKFGRISKE
jgi:hypothetical protein